MTLKCICCGHEQMFKDSEEAFHAGWDAEPHFTVGPLCDLCPASLHALKISHDAAHARWVLRGRPGEFSPTTCGTEEELR
jgi:hypothetical protein